MAKLRHDSDSLPFYDPTTAVFRVHVHGETGEIEIEAATSRQGKEDLIGGYQAGDQFVAVWPGRTRSDTFDVTARVGREYTRLFGPAKAQPPMNLGDGDDIPFE